MKTNRVDEYTNQVIGEILVEVEKRYRYHFNSNGFITQTPIEKLVFVALLKERILDGNIRFYPQFQIGKYRVDFLVIWTFQEMTAIE